MLTGTTVRVQMPTQILWQDSMLIARSFCENAAEYSFREFALSPLFPLFAKTFEVA